MTVMAEPPNRSLDILLWRQLWIHLTKEKKILLKTSSMLRSSRMFRENVPPA